MKKRLLIIAVIALLGMSALLVDELTGLTIAGKKQAGTGGRGYDWDWNAVIGYGGYRGTMIIPANLCEKHMGPQGYIVERTEINARKHNINIQEQCRYSYPYTNVPVYCCKI